MLKYAAILAAAACLLMGPLPAAHAQTASFVADPFPEPDPAPPSVGQWRVTVAHQGANTWKVTVKSIYVPGMNNAGHVQIRGVDSTTGQNVAVAGAQLGTVTRGASVHTWAGMSAVGGNRLSWSTIDTNQYIRADPSPVQDVFEGLITYQGSIAPDMFFVDITNTTMTWKGVGQISGGGYNPGQQLLVPEPVSMAMALPGLVPFGLALMRRRRRTAAAEADADGQSA